jgi:hypothetical protein
MFRDRVVSMEQTFEKGEKHLPLLKALVDEAIPGMELQDYVLDHEHDCFVMNYRTAAGTAKKISWTRMVLYDAERLPAIVENAEAEVRRRLVEFLRKRAERNVIDVTFRHLEEGWVDTPEPRKPKPQPPREKGQAGGRPGGGGGRAPQGRGAPPRPGQPAGGGGSRPQPGGRPAPGPRPAGPRPPAAPAPGGGEAPGAAAPGEGGGRRRRFRRRRGRRRGGPGSGPAAPPAGGAPAP